LCFFLAFLFIAEKKNGQHGGVAMLTVVVDAG